MPPTHNLFSAITPRYADHRSGATVNAFTELHRREGFVVASPKLDACTLITCVMTVLMWVMIVDGTRR